MRRAETRTRKPPASPRPKLPRASEEIKGFARLLENEILAWPSVNSRPMFGLTGLFHHKNIFAVLPRTRTMDTPNSIAFRLPKRSGKITERMKKDERVIIPTPEAKWISFIVESETDIHDALQWLAHAYDEAVKN
jgi:hypothetical protein